ncbi:MAG: bifunctional adenosylcobinamide kinase/adenosylcobinamide-phosphate guanylyltransferase [Eubacterium sp.]
MILIFGGAYQGKKEYVINKYKLTDAQIYNCENPDKYRNLECTGGAGELTAAAGSFSAADHLEAWILREIREKRNPEDELQDVLDSGCWEDQIVICTDITQGIVPIDAEMRKWRDQTGKCLQLLASRADEAVRVFCGIGETVKVSRDRTV